MYWFIISRAASLVWEEWGRRKKKEKVSLLFWGAVIFYLLGLASVFWRWSPFNETMASDLAALIPKVQYAALALFAGPFVFAGICLAVYFLVNVLWCLVFPLAGIQYMLDEEEKANGEILFLNRKDGK